MTTRTFPLTGAINLQVRIGRGSLVVHAQDDLTEASVRIVPRHKGSGIGERMTVELNGPTLCITNPREGGIFDLPFLGHRSLDAVDVTVCVPSGTAARISTYFADVIVHGRIGGADVSAASADVGIEQVAGDLRLRYGSGECRVDRVDGSVQTRSGSGNACFGEIHGALSSGCGSGNLEVRKIHGAVRTRAGSGTASLHAVFGDVDVASGSGPISIGLPAGHPARLDVTSGSGHVHSELPIEDAPDNDSTPIRVRARTGSGEIRLFRAA